MRARLIGALVVTSAVTLVASGVTLLSPFQARLRREEAEAVSAAATAARPSFEALRPADLRRGSPRLRRLVRHLHRRARADVVVVNGRGGVILSTDPDPRESLAEVRAALSERRVRRRLGSSDEGHEVRLAMPLRAGGARFAVALQRPLDTRPAVRVVRHALLTAALVGLGVAVLLGAALATRLARRLRRLRQAALRVAELGPGAEVHADATADEVGDLARAFADMQERLREQEEARRTFVSTASHELRTPLASLRLMLALLEEDLAAEAPDLQDARRQLIRAHGQTVRLGGLAAQLLDLSRVDAKVPLRSEPVPVGELCRSVLAEFEPRAVEEGVVLEMNASGSAWAAADPGALARIVRILLDNAIRFSPVGGQVHLDVGDGPSLSVSDEGPGVPEGEGEFVFGRFQRGSNAGSSGGFGLGLALGRELARQMGGELRLDATQGGARFTLRLRPLGDGDGHPAFSDGAAEAGGASWSEAGGPPSA